MKSKKTSVLFFALSLLFLIPPSFLCQEAETWQKWLEDVEPIITKAEEEVFKTLKTEEDRIRFINSFWRARDPDPQTPQNEFKSEYYQRLSYARNRLHGTRSDRGRIYMILGEPLERSNFAGTEQVVECELWTYNTGGRPGLPPFINLIFYKRRDFGDFEIFYPGIHTAKDILSPGYQSSRISGIEAYREISRSYGQLAQATLSVIPGEGSPNFPASASSSNTVFAQIYSLPEKEAANSYLRNFSSIEGIVDVRYSVNEVGGAGQISLSENRGYRFLNYAIMPDVIHTVKAADNLHTANLQVMLRMADLAGGTIFQRERNIEFRLTDQEKRNIEANKAMFRDFVPIIDGDYKISIVFLNKTKDEFFNYEEEVRISDKTVPVIVGHTVEKIDSAKFMPFCTDRFKMKSDPRLAFNKTDSVAGIVISEKKPEVQLIRFDDEQDIVDITDIERQGNVFVFGHPLADLRASHYYLIVKQEGTEVYKKIIDVLPLIIEKPRWFEWSDLPSSGDSYTFDMAQQYLNMGQLEKAIEYFNKLPEEIWNAKTLPVIARAYYLNKDYEKVMELLENENVKKDYSVLILLGNSSLELRQLEKAADYFEQLRNYGDTVKINQVLGAIFLSLGEREKAKVYFDRAKNILSESEIKKEG
jgi:GWxTD domain-containing protein